MKPEEAHICKCGEKMRQSRSHSLNIDGWICPVMIHEFIVLDAETAKKNHTPPTPHTHNDPH